jgi:hypothetical protein
MGLEIRPVVNAADSFEISDLILEVLAQFGNGVSKSDGLCIRVIHRPFPLDTVFRGANLKVYLTVGAPESLFRGATP